MYNLNSALSCIKTWYNYMITYSIKASNYFSPWLYFNVIITLHGNKLLSLEVDNSNYSNSNYYSNSQDISQRNTLSCINSTYINHILFYHVFYIEVNSFVFVWHKFFSPEIIHFIINSLLFYVFALMLHFNHSNIAMCYELYKYLKPRSAFSL